MASLVKLSVDGRELQAAPGTLLIEACRANGIEVPSFCYYPGFSLQAACRMCLVEIEKTPKPQTACTVPVAEGMVVRTTSPVVVESRRAMLEFLLANHPLDCPVCDKGGECELQDMVFRYGAAESRFAEEKRHVEEQQWSPVVYYDAPRCILCYRCVRVCGEGMDVWALGTVNRGGQTEIAPSHGDHLECEECGMCIDICPVGALTSGAYRYKARPWEIQYVSTPCAHCGDGCKTTLSVRNNKVLRGNNRDHSGVNGEFLCIKGRYAFDFIDHKERLRQPLIRRDGQLATATWEEAIPYVASRWKEILETEAAPMADDYARFGVIGSNHTTNEENYLLQKFARTVLATNHIDHHRSADFPSLMAALGPRSAFDDGSPRLARSRDLTSASAILLVGNNPTDQHPLIAWNIRDGCRRNKTRLYIINSAEIPLVRQSHQFLPIAPGREAAAIAYLSGDPNSEHELTGRTHGGKEVDQKLLQTFRDKLRSEKDVVVLFGDEIRGSAVEALVRLGEQLQGQTRYIALADSSNSRGASDMGLVPHLLPGYRPIDNAEPRVIYETSWQTAVSDLPGWSLGEMLDAARARRLRSLYVVGANPLKGRESVEDLGNTFLVVQDLFLTETAQAADVVLPAASAYEKSGTKTNTCGELQRLRKAVDLLGCRPDLDIFAALARAMGTSLGRCSSDEVFAEIRELVPGYAVPLTNLQAGGAELVVPNGSYLSASSETASAEIRSARDTLFTSGTLGRYSNTLNSVPERLTRNNLTRSDPLISPDFSDAASLLMSPPVLIFTLIKILVVIFVLLTAVAYVVWFERKLVAHLQSRWGPMRVGPHGLLQPLADAIKLLTKEDLTPYGASHLVFLLAPFLALMTALLPFAVIPFGPGYEIHGMRLFQVSDLDIGILFVFSVTSIGVYGIALAGWSSNNKYSLLGGLRSSAQMISYELAVTLSVVGVLLLSGTLSLRGIVDAQAGTVWGFFPRWNVFPQIIGFCCYITGAIAETNRLPFDLPEAETELVAGYHTEYSSMKFAMFFMAEYANMVTVSCLATVLFFGGWHGPVFGPAALRFVLPLFWFCLKVFCFLFAYVWIRGTLPRFRYDQLMSFGWKFLVPVALANLVVTSFIIAMQ